MQLLEMLDSLLDRLDLNDPHTVQHLAANKPSGFVDSAGGMQKLLLVGLRSITTYPLTFKILSRLSSIEDETLIDNSGHRL
ncbi:hypothetical protein, partial [Klebsiella pneumoniae]|uniref:hypothetical protein n=1 Tax=Klebsiella pneumoniae TaxID=573 RepID=UPI001C5D2285